ncbi:MAG: hypothetical protein AAGD10_07265 [Myxococcota bacterium]
MYHEVTALRMQSETPRTQLVAWSAPEALRHRHREVGQVLKMDRVGGGDPVYLALASQPGDEHFETLVSPDAVDALRLREGQVATVRDIIGRGFPVGEALGKDVLLFGVGSALGPIRAAVEAIRRRRSEFGWVRLYAGVRSGEVFPFERDFETWTRDRIDILACHSRPWVQERFLEDVPDLEDAIAFVCGMESMMEGVTQALTEQGLPQDRVHRNY